MSSKPSPQTFDDFRSGVRSILDTTLAKAQVDIEQLFDRLCAEGPAVEVGEPPAVPVATVGEGRAPIVWGAKVGQPFVESVWWISDALTKVQGSFFDPNWLMGCMAWETGEKFSPSVKNLAGSGATGLIQFMPSTAKELGEYRGAALTTSTLAAMTAVEQLAWVYWYFRLQIERHGAITNLEDCYMAILWPSAIGSPVSAALWNKATRPTTYRQNAGFDKNKDGIITKLEATERVWEKLRKGLPLAA